MAAIDLSKPQAVDADSKPIQQDADTSLFFIIEKAKETLFHK